nr:MAG TPA: hypothetical protein [Caudoviricetes sp.]
MKIKIEDKTFIKRFEVFREANNNRFTMKRKKYRIRQYYTDEGSRYEVFSRGKQYFGSFRITESSQYMHSNDISEENMLLIIKGISDTIRSYHIPLKYDGYSCASYVEEAMDRLRFSDTNIHIGYHDVQFEVNRLNNVVGYIKTEARTNAIDVYNMQMTLQYQYYDDGMHIFYHKSLVKGKEHALKIYYKFLIAMCSLIEYQYINCLTSVEKIPF